MMIRALISDLDGTLVETERANFVAYRAALAEVGRSLDEVSYRAAFGLRVDRLLAQVAPGLTADEAARVRASKARHYQDNLALVSANEGLLGFLRSMKPVMRLALASTASRANGMAVLEHIGASALFDCLVFGEDVRHGKPDPECYRVAMERLKAAPDECLVFEDTELGTQAAVAAGARVVVVPPAARWDDVETGVGTRVSRGSA